MLIGNRINAIKKQDSGWIQPALHKILSIRLVQ